MFDKVHVHGGMVEEERVVFILFVFIFFFLRGSLQDSISL